MEKLNRKCIIGAHNAYSSSAYRWLYKQQALSFREQFDIGVRMFLIDIYWHNYACRKHGADRTIAMKHGNSDIVNSVLIRQGPPMKLDVFLEFVRDTLIEFPDEVIIVQFESYLGEDGGELWDLFNDYDLVDRVHLMISDSSPEKRFIPFSNNISDGVNNSGTYITENHWDFVQFPNADKIRGNGQSMLMLNHFHPVSIFRNYDTFNSAENIVPRLMTLLRATAAKYNNIILPICITVDFVEYGDVAAICNRINMFFAKEKNPTVDTLDDLEKILTEEL